MMIREITILIIIMSLRILYKKQNSNYIIRHGIAGQIVYEKKSQITNSEEK